MTEMIDIRLVKAANARARRAMRDCLTTDHLRDVIARYGDGVLTAGVHQYGDGAVCVMEACALACDRPLSDEPTDLPDLRPLNDARWSSDAARTAAMIPLAVAFADWADDPARQTRFVVRLAIETVRVIVAELPGLPATVRGQGRAVTSLADAARAAHAAANANADAADYAQAAAYAAAHAAAHAADAADEGLTTACALWMRVWQESRS